MTKGLVPPRGQAHLVFDRRSRRWVNPSQNPTSPRLSPGSILRHKLQARSHSEGSTSKVLIGRAAPLVPDPPGIAVCPPGLVSHQGQLMAEPEWEEGGEYIYLHSQSPAIARAVHHRISGSHISALFSHDDSPEARRWMVRVGTSYIDVQGVKDRTSALGDQAQGVLVDVSESEMLDLLREERAGDAQNWELARQRVDRIPGLVAVVR